MFFLKMFQASLIRKKIACLPPQQDCYLSSAMHVMPFRPCPKHSKFVKAENRAHPAVSFLIKKALRSGKKCVLKKSATQQDFFHIFATSVKDRLALWFVMASGLGPRDLKAHGSTFCCK